MLGEDMKKLSKVFLSCATILGLTAPIMAQGQDSTPGERNVRIIGELLPGTYSTANQALFDGRRKLSDAEKHGNQLIEITRRESDANVFDVKGSVGGVETSFAMTLSSGPSADEMQAKLSVDGDDLDCVVVFQRRAEHYAGLAYGSDCPAYGVAAMQVSQNEVWIKNASKPFPYWYERARMFHCYADLPGVSGGRDEPFERYDNIMLHDKGGTHWFETRGEEKRTLGIALQSITWHVLNENNGNFNRNSLVLYTLEKFPDGSMKEHPYTFTEPSAERIGYNLRWILVNCSMVPRHEARPAM